VYITSVVCECYAKQSSFVPILLLLLLLLLHCKQPLPLSREAEEERLLAEQKAHQFKARPYDK
jgi:hypothetical protein